MGLPLLLHERKHQGAPPRTPEAALAAATLVDEKTAVSASQATTALSVTTIALAVDDQLVLKRVREGGTASGTWAAPSGGGLTWTSRAQVFTASRCQVEIWTSSRVTSAGAVTVNSGTTSVAQHKSITAEAWRGAATFDGTQAIIELTAASGLPDQHLLSTKLDKSTATWAIGDWSAATPGTPGYSGGATEQVVHTAAGAYVAYHARQPALLSGPQRTGVRTPAAGQAWSIAALEVQGITASSGVTGSGAPSAPAATAQGSGVAQATGAGAPTAQAGAATGAGTVRATGSGTAAAQAAAATGTGSASTSGSGSATAPAGVASGAGTSSTPSTTGSGAASAVAGQAAGAGTARVTSAGSATAAGGSATGAGSARVTGQGAATAAPATADGDGLARTTGTGAATAGAGLASGTTGTPTATGSGTASAAPGSATGAGTTRATGAGSISAPTATAQGSGATGTTGSGSATAAPGVADGAAAATDPDYIPPELEVGPATPPRFTAAAARVSTVTVTRASRSLTAGPARPNRYRRQP